MEKQPDLNNQKSEVALKEEEVLKFWNEKKIFQKTLDKKSPKGDFVFYDGPPFATGTPHYGHLLPGTMKDVIPRFKTMQGYHVSRRWGWDCHGLPIENLVEKELGLATKKDIEDFGIEKFNEAARASVLRYEKVWKETIPRVGRWVDMDDPYMSMQPTFMETGWWIFGELYKKNLITKGFKAMHLCPRCETTLANFEVNQGYKDITDLSLIAEFELVEEPGTFVLAWTTTPWTLPGNVALAVGEDVDYVKVKIENEFFVIAKNLLEKVLKDKTFEIVSDFKGKELLGKSYKPLFDYYEKDEKLENRDRGWKIYGADFVTTEDGTGVVHIAPAFGSDDMELGKKNNLPFVQHVTKSGHFKPEVTDFAGKFVKPKDDHQSADIEVVKNLAHRGFLFSKEKYTHSYPHCWRCDTPLLNYATDSWFLDTPQIKDRMIKNNQTTKWVPENLRDGRFGNWLEGAREWALSRSRFWGTPLPVWQTSDGRDTLVISSEDELMRKSGDQITKIIFVRHGQSVKNLIGLFSDEINDLPLTSEGKKQAREAGERLKSEGVDFIYSSPVLRTKQTAEIISKAVGGVEVVEAPELIEVDSGTWDGKTIHDKDIKKERDEYLGLSVEDRYLAKRGHTGESWMDVEKRVKKIIDRAMEEHKGKTVVFVSHMGVNTMGQKVVQGLTNDETEIIYNKSIGVHASPKIFFMDLKRKKEFDMHRPYIDEIVIKENGKTFKRVEDVFDVWFDSASMPYAQKHYPFEKDGFDPKGGFLRKSKGFPADFIAEGLDQTRGWFYVLMVLGTALFDKSPYKNVLVNGLVLAEDGKKMSKSLKNYPEMDLIINKYGADAVRLFLMNSPAVRGEDVLFSEKGVSEIQSKVMARLRNILSFWQMYEGGEKGKPRKKNILDAWIISRLDEVIKEVTKSLKKYEIDRGIRPIIDFVDDFSNWYVRRSRDRFKSEDKSDREDSLATTRFVLREISRVIAPYAPFVADEVYRAVSDKFESVHLETWPKDKRIDKKVLKNMATTREMVSLGLMERQKLNIKVKQPLKSLTIAEKLPKEYLELIKDEVNVKEVLFGDELKLDTEITEELKQEGDFREVLRFVQSLRKDADLNPEEKVYLFVDTDKNGKAIIQKFEDELKRVAGVTSISFEENNGQELSLDDLVFKVSIKK
ncbi:MAG: class I tRNA ligase family protein [Candidatus Paceibacterota bacterium]